MDPRPAVFLDRDGVLNEPVLVDGRPHPPATVDDLVVRDDTEGACRELKRAGALLIVVTNQPDIARGTCDRETVDAINDALRRRLALDDVLVCPHDDADRCACRKPRTGLFEEASRRWRVDLAASVMVGDRWRDIEAGRAAGCATVLIDRQYDERPAVGADLTVRTLSEAVPWIVSRGISGGAREDFVPPSGTPLFARDVRGAIPPTRGEAHAYGDPGTIQNLPRCSRSRAPRSTTDETVV